MENNSLEDVLFGPLDKKYCMYFYAITIASFAFFLIVAFLFLGLFIKGKKKMSFYAVLVTFAIVLEAFFHYFQNRLLYTICVHTHFK
jgi:hypothetical protein